MGHLINPIALRLGSNREWCIKSGNFFVNNHFDKFLRYYVESVFDSKFLRDWGFIYSHMILDQRLSNVTLRVYIYDGISEAIFSKLLVIFQIRKQNFKTNKKKLLIIALKKASLLKNGFANNVEFTNFLFFRKGFTRCFGVDICSEFFRNLLNIKIRFVFYKFLQEFVNKDLNCVFNNFFIPLKIEIKHLHRYFLTASSIALYITRKLEYQYTLTEIVTPLVKGLESVVTGFFVRCSGRFTRVQRAQRRDFRVGISPQSTLSLAFDYSFRISRLKYGVCGIKVWLVR